MITSKVNDDYAARLLHTDIAIIASNEEHLVLAIRVDRRALKRNHSLLAALSDLADGTGAPPRPPSHRAWHRYLKPVAMTLIAAAILASFIAVPQAQTNFLSVHALDAHSVRSTLCSPPV
jgi:hypothetical protein